MPNQCQNDCCQTIIDICSQIIIDKRFDLLPEIEKILNDIPKHQQDFDDTIGLLLSYIYYIMLSAPEKELYFAIRSYVIRQVFKVSSSFLKNKAEIIYGKEASDNAAIDVKICWDTTLYCLNKYNGLAGHSKLKHSNELIQKFIGMVHQTRYSKFPNCALYSYCMYLGTENCVKELSENLGYGYYEIAREALNTIFIDLCYYLKKPKNETASTEKYDIVDELHLI